jgi:nucleoside-diphosphate-sugar epimerase
MRVFVTGATGFIGSAIVQELIGAGHQVLGLARSEASASALIAAGAAVHRGTLEDLESLRSGAAASDGVIHTAFIHDFSQYLANAEIDRKAIEAMAAALEGSNKPFVSTSGTLVLTPGKVGTEDYIASAGSPAGPRADAEVIMMDAANRGVRTSVVRLPPSVHGDGDRGFVPALIAIAREKGVSAYIGDGLNRWPAVHRLDAALLFRLALEKGTAGSRFHGVGDEGVPVREMAEVIGRRLNVPVVTKTPEEAADHFGWLAVALGMDCPASSAQTQELLGWRPTRPGLIADLDRPQYFEI